MKPYSRRDFLRDIGWGKLIASGVGSAWGAPIQEGSKVVDAGKDISRGAPAILENGAVVQPRREIPVLRETDVLVVGGGTAGVVAALAAARLIEKMQVKEVSAFA